MLRRVTSTRRFYSEPKYFVVSLVDGLYWLIDWFLGYVTTLLQLYRVHLCNLDWDAKMILNCFERSGRGWLEDKTPGNLVKVLKTTVRNTSQFSRYLNLVSPRFRYTASNLLFHETNRNIRHLVWPYAELMESYFHATYSLEWLDDMTYEDLTFNAILINYWETLKPTH
jgi:hypothetical protein